MKILSLVLVLIVATVANSQTRVAKGSTAKRAYARPYGMAGCGLGSVVVGKNGAQISAATTNGTSWNQTFGISAGTLNCVDTPTAEVAGRLDHFILVNRAQIQGDIARGSGETILALGSYMGCTDSSLIGAELKANYSGIFKGEVKTNDITDSIISVILSSPDLSQQCNKLS